MNFRTEINIERSSWEIEHENKLITIGSCFAENISVLLKDHRFNVLENPFGVLYNPVSIYNAIKLLAEKKKHFQKMIYLLTKKNTIVFIIIAIFHIMMLKFVWIISTLASQIL